MTVEAIIFDFDGVIVESVDIKTHAFATLLEDEPEEIVTAAIEYHLANTGLSRYAKFAYVHEALLGRPLDEAGMAALDARYSALVVDAVVACPMVSGARAFLDARSREAPLYVVSGTPQYELREIVERRDLEGYFGDVLGSPAHKVENMRRILGGRGYDPKSVPMIGDSRLDFDAALELGTPFIGRVPPGKSNPFPTDVTTVPDLVALERQWCTYTTSQRVHEVLG